MKVWYIALYATACTWVGDEEYAGIRDLDGDGGIATRFGGNDCVDDEPSIADCDQDNDGFLTESVGGTDCDDTDPTVRPNTLFHVDLDGDGFGDPEQTRVGCLPPIGTVADGTDCDDEDGRVYPTAEETCDPLDRNCDGDPWLGADATQWFWDRDGDGHGNAADIGDEATCQPPEGQVAIADDCDDEDPAVFPGADRVWYDGRAEDCLTDRSDFDQDLDGEDAALPFGTGTDCDDTDPSVGVGAPELCDEVDNNCNLLVDDQDADEAQTGQLTFYLDGDRDGVGSSESSEWCPNAAPAGQVLLTGDCDDTRSTIAPGATEVCNQRDDDCNGVADDGAIDEFPVYEDLDGDGFGGLEGSACAVVDGYVTLGGDCDDSDPVTFPGAEEVCDDAVRQDCSTFSPDDCDSDGQESTEVGGTDCDDDDSAVRVGATELCDGIDNDCDMLLDGDDPQVLTYPDWYLDLDGDDHGVAILVATDTCTPPPFSATSTDDCDDTRSTVFPGAREVCNGRDDDCDTFVDESATETGVIWFWDNDGDGAGDDTITLTDTCVSPAGEPWVDLGGDCDDADPERSPFSEELCDGLDNDCDDDVDDDDPDVSRTAPAWYLDADADGFGVTSAVERSCAPPLDHAPVAGDCSDSNPAINPGAQESCNGGIDDDCDGLPDDNDPDLVSALDWYQDLDGDGFGDPTQTSTSCGQPPGYVPNSLDCDDGLPSVSPNALERCNLLDDDCNGLIDEADVFCFGAETRYADGDGDGEGAGAGTVVCGSPSGTSLSSRDCDDANPAVNPSSSEICGPDDEDCDGLVDDADPSVVGDLWFEDGDGDGVGGSIFLLACDASGAGYTQVTGDCVDLDPLIGPGRTETCDGVDQDCDGLVDDGAAGSTLFVPDADADGYGSGASVAACDAPFGHVPAGGPVDCDDGDPAVHPGSGEVCGGSDEDCDGLVDEADSDLLGAYLWFADTDEDGFGAWSVTTRTCWSPPAVGNWSSQADDCDDTDPLAWPGGPEDCTWAGTESCRVRLWFRDADGDSYGDPGDVVRACTAPSGFVGAGGDCDDSVPGDVSEHLVADAVELAAAVGAPGCPRIVLDTGFDDEVRIQPASGREVSVTSLDPADPGVLRQDPGQSVLEATNPGVVTLESVRLSGATGKPLIDVNDAGATVVVDDLTIDGERGSQGIRANSGALVAHDVRIQNGSNNINGSAIEVSANGAVDATAITVRASLGDSAVNLDCTGSDVAFAGLQVWSSARVRARGTGRCVLTDVDLWESVDDALTTESAGTLLDVTGLLVVRPADTGVRADSGQPTTLRRATIVSAGGSGVSGARVSVVDGIVLWSAGSDLEGVGVGVSYDHALFDTLFGPVSGTSLVTGVPDFVAFDRQAPLNRLDFHQQPTSVGVGSGSVDDLGRYAAGDPWYLDEDADGLPDGWEYRWFGDNLVFDDTSDADGDGGDGGDELFAGTCPADVDSDDDGALDGGDASPLDPTRR